MNLRKRDLYSGAYNTVFVHIPKTAGQSIERVFVEKHGLTWQTRAPLLLRKKAEGERGPMRLAHLFASEYVAFGYLTPERFARAFKFTVVRHPYDRAISEFRYLNRNRHESMEAFQRELRGHDLIRHLAPQAAFIFDEAGNQLVDHIARFERLADEFARLSERIFGHSMPLPHVNKSGPATDADVFDFETRQLIYKRYERDFDLFKYPVEPG